MADEENKEKQEDVKQEKETKKAHATGILTWIIMAVVVVVCAAAGFGLARLFASSSASQTTESAQTDEATRPENPKSDDSTADSKAWYYDLEPVVANLNEPSVTRYVRATITLEISSELSQTEGNQLLEKKKPVLISWLTVYLAGLTLEDTRGDKNLRRIQSQILDALNELLFPDAKPQIKHILLKEFAIQ